MKGEIRKATKNLRECLAEIDVNTREDNRLYLEGDANELERQSEALVRIVRRHADSLPEED